MKKRAENNSHWQNNIAADGFAILPSVADENACSELIRDLQSSADADLSVRQRGKEVYAIRNLLESVAGVASLSRSLTVRALVEPVLGPGAMAVRGLLFDKTRQANWKVAWHQDLSIAVQRRLELPGFGPWSTKAGVHHVQPPASVLENMLTLRLHLDDCGVENGPLQVLPGSHQAGKLSAEKIAEWRERRSPVVCSVPRGGVLLMRPLLLHASSAALSPGHRRVIHLEFAAAPLSGGMEWLANQSFTGPTYSL